MRQVNREDEVETINCVALRLARDVAHKTGKMFAGNICGTNMYKPGDAKIEAEIRKMFDKQICWAKEEGAEFIIAETIPWVGEAEIALDAIKSHGLPAVVTYTMVKDEKLQTLDNYSVGEVCKVLLDKGAYLVGVNCARRPEQTLELVEEIIKICPPEKVCALPLGYRTTKNYSHLFSLWDDACRENHRPYPHGLEAFGVAPVEITKFTKRCLELCFKYMGVCCGNPGMLTNAMAKAMGKTTEVSRYHEPESKGTDPYKYIDK